MVRISFAKLNKLLHLPTAKQDLFKISKFCLQYINNWKPTHSGKRNLWSVGIKWMPWESYLRSDQVIFAWKNTMTGFWKVAAKSVRSDVSQHLRSHQVWTISKVISVLTPVFASLSTGGTMAYHSFLTAHERDTPQL